MLLMHNACSWPFSLSSRPLPNLFASLCLYKSEILLVHQNPKTQVILDDSTISTYMRYYPAVLGKLHVPPLNFKWTYVFCAWTTHGAIGAVSIFHAKWVILMMGVYSLTFAQEGGNRDAQSWNQKLQIIKQNSPMIVVGRDSTRGFG